jgi:hypothetical protein
MSGAITKLAEKWDTQGKIVDAYKNTDVGNLQARNLLIECAKKEVFPRTQLLDVIDEWETPRHPEFNDRNLWSLMNAVTEHLKPRENSTGSTLWVLPQRTERLHSILDPVAGVELLSPQESIAA